MEVLKDKDCTIDTPVVLGVQDSPIYGKGISIKPRVDGRKDSKHFESIYLPELLPLEEYDLIVVLISGGKDSIACFYKLLELGVPKEKIELWHHDIDGGHPSRRMDWKCTQNYMKALADAEGVKLRVSYRVNGFFGELYRIGASEPIEWIDPDTDEVKQPLHLETRVVRSSIQMVILLLHIVVKKIHLVTFGSGLMVSMFITRMKVLFILLTMDSRMIQMQHHILMQESQFVVQMVMFLLLLIMKTLIGYSLQVKFLEIVHFQLVTIFGRTKHIMATRSLYWAVVGLMVLVRAVSIGV